MSFADLEVRTNAAVMRMLSNATATVEAGAFKVIFDEAWSDPLGMVDSTSPAATALDSDLAANAVAQDTAIDIGGVAYRVRSVHPQGGGMSVLLLRRGA